MSIEVVVYHSPSGKCAVDCDFFAYDEDGESTCCMDWEVPAEVGMAQNPGFSCPGPGTYDMVKKGG